MSKTTFTTTSALVCPDLGKDGQVKGPFPTLTVTAKRTVKDAEFSLAVPVHTASQSRSLNGTMLSVKSNYNNLEAKAGVDLGTKYKTAGALYKKSLDAPGRKLDLEAIWKEKGGQVDLIALYKHDTQKKASIKYDLNKQLALLTLGYEKDGLTVEPAIKYNVDSQEASPILSLSQKNGADTLKATYDINGEHGSLEWSHKEYKLIAKAPIQYKGGFKAKAPTVLLTFTKDFEAGGETVSKRNPDDLEVNRGAPGSLVALEESRQGPLGDRLRAIDAVNLEKKRDLTAANIRKNREGNKGTVAGHD